MRYFRLKTAFLTFCILLAGGAALVRAVSAQDAGTEIKVIEGAGGGPSLNIEEAPIRTQIPIPGSKLETLASGIVVGRVQDLADYLNIVYNFLISIVGIVAAVTMMWGGIGYLTAGGDTSRVKVARERIGNALIGLILALASFVILNTVNPALVTLKVPDVSPVKTVTSFMPFCDSVAKELNTSITTAVAAPTKNKPNGCYFCGCPGYFTITQTTAKGGVRVDSTGKPIQVRRWCTFRGNTDSSGNVVTKKHKNPDMVNTSYVITGGCGQSGIFTAEVGSDNTAYVPQVCIPSAKYGVDELEKQLLEKEIVTTDLARCLNCPLFDQDSMIGLGYNNPPEACQVWMNLANNGNPVDSSFTVNNKNETNWRLDTSRPDQMYYCGYSKDRRSCVFSNIRCKTHTKSCSAYNDDQIYFCDREGMKGLRRGEQRCYDEDFASYTGTYADHLTPVCLGDPCDAGNCEQGDLFEATNIVGAGAEASRGLQVLSAGIINSSECE